MRTGRGPAAALIGCWGAALTGAGLFTTDPVSGYPAGTPATADYTTSGALHDGISVPGFLALAVAQLVLARGGGRRWVLYSGLSAAGYVAALLLANAGFAQSEPFVDVAGLCQRVAVVIGWAWTVAVAIRAGSAGVEAADSPEGPHVPAGHSGSELR